LLGIAGCLEFTLSLGEAKGFLSRVLLREYSINQRSVFNFLRIHDSASLFRKLGRDARELLQAVLLLVFVGTGEVLLTFLIAVAEAHATAEETGHNGRFSMGLLIALLHFLALGYRLAEGAVSRAVGLDQPTKF